MSNSDRPIARATIITVSGGKGGVGKTFFSVNFAADLQARGHRVLVFDADLNLSNVNLMAHVNADIRFSDCLWRKIFGLKTLFKALLFGIGAHDDVRFGDLKRSIGGIAIDFDYLLIVFDNCSNDGEAIFEQNLDLAAEQLLAF